LTRRKSSSSSWAPPTRIPKTPASHPLITSPALAYGKRGAPPDIPPSSTLVFDIRLLAVRA